jgi:hypothetical protein
VSRVDVICSFCGEPWSAHAANHQPGCDAANRYALRVPRARELQVYALEREPFDVGRALRGIDNAVRPSFDVVPRIRKVVRL